MRVLLSRAKSLADCTSTQRPMVTDVEKLFELQLAAWRLGLRLPTSIRCANRRKPPSKLICTVKLNYDGGEHYVTTELQPAVEFAVKAYKLAGVRFPSEHSYWWRYVLGQHINLDLHTDVNAGAQLTFIDWLEQALLKETRP